MSKHESHTNDKRSAISTLHALETPIPFLRSAYDGLSDVVSHSTGIDFSRPPGLSDVEWSEHPNYSLTVQSSAEECDINTIVNKFLRTGEMPDETAKPRYGDFTGAVNNYHDALNLIIEADEAFMQLPAKIRARFDNDAGQYVDFFNDPKNRAEAEELGLIQPRQESSTKAIQNKPVGEDSSAPVSEPKSSSKKGGKSASDDD